MLAEIMAADSGQWKWTWTWHTHGMQMEPPDKRRSLQFASRFARNSTSRPQRTFCAARAGHSSQKSPSWVPSSPGRPWFPLADGRLERCALTCQLMAIEMSAHAERLDCRQRKNEENSTEENIYLVLELFSH